jgi:hypothetical protein
MNKLYTSYQLFVESRNNETIISIQNKGIYANTADIKSIYIGDELAEVRADKKANKYYLFVGDYKRVCEVPADRVEEVQQFFAAINHVIGDNRASLSQARDINGIKENIANKPYYAKELPKAMDGLEYAVRELRVFSNHPINMKKVMHNGQEELVYWDPKSDKQ